MALGGGTWTTQNKILPGTYINFSSVAKASTTLSERGYAAMPLMLDWGPEGDIFIIENTDFEKDCFKLFGYQYTDAELLPLRELFAYAKTVYAYRLNGGGVKASNTYCTAKYTGTVGNKLTTVISANVDDAEKYDVKTLYNTTVIDIQTVATSAELKANDFVEFKSTALAETAGLALTGGTNGTVAASAHQTFLDKLESYNFNVLGCPSADNAIITLYKSYTERMRDQIGAKFQTVIYEATTGDKTADYEGIISIGNSVSGYDTISGMGAYGLVYWVTGVEAACAVEKSNTNKLYDGELTVGVDYTQSELESYIQTGRFMLHRVDEDIRVLEDINSLVTTTDTKGDVFKANQTIRVIDQIANDIATVFNTKYLGTVPNDNAGRVSLWNDIVNIHMSLETLRALEDFDSDTVQIAQGDSKKAVVCTVSNLNIVNAMAQLYLSVVVQ